MAFSPSCLILLSVAIVVHSIPYVIRVDRQNLISNGLDHNPIGQYFMISSINIGSIYQVDYDGHVQTFTPGEVATGMIGSSGLVIDYLRGVIHVANGKFPPVPYPQAGIQASYTQINITTQGSILWVNLTGVGHVDGQVHAANDLDIDPEGNIYLTDSYGGKVWRINGTTYAAETLVANPAFNAADGVSIGLNGILYHPNGYLVCSKSGSSGISKLFKIYIQNRTAIQVNVSGLIQGADGIEWDPSDKSHLYLAGGRFLYTLRTNDDWVSAQVITRQSVPESCNIPATITAPAQDQTYVICHQSDGYESIQFIQVPVEGESSWWVYFVIVIGLIMLTVAILTPYWMKKCGCNRIRLPSPRVKDRHVELQETPEDASRSNRDIPLPSVEYSSPTGGTS